MIHPEEMIYRSVDGDLSPGEEAELHAHLATCRSCQDLLSALVRDEERLRDEIRVHAADLLSGGFEERVLTSLASTRRVRWVPVLVGSLAAAVILVGSLLLLGPRSHPPAETGGGDRATADSGPSVERASEDAPARVEPSPSLPGSGEPRMAFPGPYLGSVDTENLDVEAARDRIAGALYSCADEPDDELLPAFEERIAPLRAEGWPVDVSVSRLTDHPELRVADTAVRVLGRAGRSSDVATLSDCLRDERLTRSAVRALGRSRSDRAAAVLAAHLRETLDIEASLESLARCGTRAAQEAIAGLALERLAIEGPEDPVLSIAVGHLGAMGSTSIDLLGRLLVKGAPETLIAEAMGTPDGGARKAIALAVAGRTRAFAVEAALALARLFRVEEAVPPLVTRVRMDIDPSGGLATLGSIGGPQAAVSLLEIRREVPALRGASLDHALARAVFSLEDREGALARFSAGLSRADFGAVVEVLAHSDGKGAGRLLVRLAASSRETERKVHALLAAGGQGGDLGPSLRPFLAMESSRVRVAALLSSYRLSPESDALDLGRSGPRRTRLASLLDKTVERWRATGALPEEGALDSIARIWNVRGQG
jgi:hypothetical protein